MQQKSKYLITLKAATKEKQPIDQTKEKSKQNRVCTLTFNVNIIYYANKKQWVNREKNAQISAYTKQHILLAVLITKQNFL